MSVTVVTKPGASASLAMAKGVYLTSERVIMEIMDRQLTWITNLFHENNIRYWVDMGTLLGLIRDGKLMDNDNDIDFSTWDEEFDKLEDLIPDIKKEGYRLTVMKYKNYKYQYVFTPKKNRRLRSFDIHIYYNAANLFAWSPQRYTKKVVHSLFSKVLVRTMLFFWLHRPTEISIDKFPLSIISGVITWWIPAKHFEQIVFSEKYRVFIPKSYKEHLELHYGNWEIPVKKWAFIFDDKALKHKKPEELIKSLSSRSSLM